MNIGKKIKGLRQASDLTQEELANRARLTKGFISQMENEKFQTSISVDSLADILDALGVSLSEFFQESNKEQVVFKPSERVAVDVDGVEKFELLIPGSTNNQMDPVLLNLKQGEKLEPSNPHPGEQFGYVLNGTATLKLGKKSYNIPSKHCFYFRSDKVHQLLNNSKREVKILWITTPPQM